MRSNRPLPQPPRSNDGYTLTELMVVMVILAVIAGALPSAVLAVLPSARVEAAASQTVSFLEAIRQSAAASGGEAVVTIAARGTTVALEREGETLTFPENLALTYTPQFSADTKAQITFYPDGTSSGGQLTLALSGRIRTVDLHWLTGRVSQGSLSDD